MKRILFLLSILLFTFKGLSNDLALNPTITSPVSGCMLSSTSVVSLFIVNVSASPYFSASIDVSYSVNGAPPVVETQFLAGPINPSVSINFTFSIPVDLSACGDYVFDFNLVAPGDVNLANNSFSTTIYSDCPPVVGAITGPTSVCETINSGSMNLTGYTGNIVNWISSTNFGTTWASTGNTTVTENFTNLPDTTYYQVIVGSPYGYCPNDTTATHIINTTPLTVPGTVMSDANVCDNGNNGTLYLSGHNGDVNYWEYSTNGGATWTTISTTLDSYNYTNIFTSTIFQANVQSGNCPDATSGQATLTVIAGSNAGSIFGEDTVCNALNDSLLTVTGYYGNITGWQYSSDTGATWIATGINTPTYSYAALSGYTIFQVIVTEGTCPPDTATKIVVVLPINVSGGPNHAIIEGSSVQLSGSGGVSYYWFPDDFMDDNNIQNPTVTPEYTITYAVQVTDEYNCMDTAFVTITILPDIGLVQIPNLITPNGDGFNDEWVIAHIDQFPEAEVYVFNAYGAVIFRASPYNNDWDATFNGQKLPDGTYFYLVKLDNDNAPIKGAITVLSKN